MVQIGHVFWSNAQKNSECTVFNMRFLVYDMYWLFFVQSMIRSCKSIETILTNFGTLV